MSQHDDFTDSLSSDSESLRPLSESDGVPDRLHDTDSSLKRHSMRSASPSCDNPRKDILPGNARASRTQVVIVVGPPGYVMFNIRLS